MKKRVLIFMILTLIVSCSPTSQLMKKYEVEMEKLSEAYNLYKNAEYKKAIDSFTSFREKYNHGYYNYEVIAFISDCFYKLNEEDKGKEYYQNAIKELKEYIDTLTHPVTYEQLALDDLTRWQKIYPKLPKELQNFIPEDEIPQPIGGFSAIEKNIAKIHGNGRVIANALINEQGDVVDVIIRKSFDERASRATIIGLKKTKFTIPKRKGRIAKFWVSIPILFRYH